MTSLTNLLRSSTKESIELRDHLKELFPTPKLNLGRDHFLPVIAKSPSLVGKAFDYAIRFHLERAYPLKVFARSWIAESAMGHFRDTNEPIWLTGKQADMSPEQLFDFLRGQQNANGKTNKQVSRKFSACKVIHSEFVKGQQIPIEDLLDTCLFLGQLDDIIRIGPSSKQFIDTGPPNEQNLADLKALCLRLDVSVFKPQNKAILNPTFGSSSIKIGADCDLIVDDLLIDIKTVKDAKIDRATLNQILCYYLLYRRGGIVGHPDTNVEAIGIYFSRYNHLWKMSVSKLMDRKTLERSFRLLGNACKTTGI